MGRRLRGAKPWPLDIDLAFNSDEPRDPHGEWMTLYHGTSVKRAALAQKVGLHPGAHLTSNPKAAQQYARYASGGTAFTRNKRKQGVVLAVRVRADETRPGEYGPDSFVADHRVTTTLLDPSRLATELLDLAFDPAEPRDAHGRWASSPATALRKAIHGDVEDLEKMVRADQGPTRFHMPQLSGAPIPGSKADALPHAPGQEVDLTPQFEKELRAAGVSVQDTQVPIADLKPTQDALVMSQVAGLAKFMLKAPATSSVFEPIFVSADNHVIDGHHRWAARQVRARVNGTPAETMAVRKIGLNIADALPIATQFMDEWGLPRAGRTASTTVSNFAPLNLAFDLAFNLGKLDLNLANPSTQQAEPQNPPPPSATTEAVIAIAAVLLLGLPPATLAEQIAGLLVPWGVSAAVVDSVLGLMHRGTVHRPNARLKGARPTALVHSVRNRELYFRAAYIANASLRLARSLRRGGVTPADALDNERRYFTMHEEARRGRLDAAAQVQIAADWYGPVLGWYLNPLKNNEAECIAANGHNFYADEGTVIGLPGSVHNRCGCYAGPPWEGAAMVDDVFANLRALRPPGSAAKFKLKESRTA